MCSVPAVTSSNNATYGSTADLPVNYLTWTQAQQYCKWRGDGFDLPTEAQWEMAARGDCEKNGSSASDPNCKTLMRKYPWGAGTPTCSLAIWGQSGTCGMYGPGSVGTIPAGDSPYGVHDMAGNVAEWTRDWYGSYPAGDQIDPGGIASGIAKVQRGGSFETIGADSLSTSGRTGLDPASHTASGGLRCAKPVCSNAAVCDDSNVCTSDSCGAGNTCQHLPLGPETSCGTGKVCDGKGGCMTVPAGMTVVSGASFWMGCNAAKDAGCQTDENPQHKVTLSSYLIDVTEITSGQYKACVDASVCTAPTFVQPAQDATYPGLTANPVNYLGWDQARQFCQWRGVGYDLPTEAQWEMAARGSCEKNGSTAADPGCKAAMRTFPWGDTVATCDLAVMNAKFGAGCGAESTWPVGSRPAGDSPYGIHDLAGNVWEWNRDWYAAYTAADQTDPVNLIAGTHRVERGGAFYYNPPSLRSGFRSQDDPVYAMNSIGLRCVRAYQ